MEPCSSAAELHSLPRVPEASTSTFDTTQFDGSVHSLPGHMHSLGATANGSNHGSNHGMRYKLEIEDAEGSVRSGKLRWRGNTEGSVHSRISSGSVRLSALAGDEHGDIHVLGLSGTENRSHGSDKALDRLGTTASSQQQPHAAVVVEQAEEAPVVRWAPRRWAKAYARKFAGGTDHRLPIPDIRELILSTLGAFCSILAICGLNELLLPHVSTTLLIPSLGATAVLVWGAPESKLAQPRNVMCGQFISALVGLAARNALGSILWLSAPVGMSMALLAMMLTATTHPPGGATALIASSAQQLAPGYGFTYLGAVMIATTTMLLIALALNNLLPKRTYPRYWWGAPGIFK